jgi:hypothetical protein
MICSNSFFIDWASSLSVFVLVVEALPFDYAAVLPSLVSSVSGFYVRPLSVYAVDTDGVASYAGGS